MSDRRVDGNISQGSRSRLPAAALLLCAVWLPGVIVAAGSLGGSLALTGDYLVRGISRSNHKAAFQADAHVATGGGFIGGLFASTVQFDAGDHLNEEFSAFLGFAWQTQGAWRTKLLASYYSYPWNDSGSRYNYVEIGAEAAYDDWLDIDIVYSPDAPRDLPTRGLIGVAAKSAEVNLRTPWHRRLAASAGVGYADLSGPNADGYVYWSAGGILDLAPWSVSLSYVNTSARARNLYYDAATHDRWTATVIWRF